jgi:hypothetical protein
MWLPCETKSRNWNSRFANKPAGYEDNGYIRIQVDGVKYLAHRIAWVFIHGSIDDGIEPDHKDRNGLNNSQDNLRCATAGQQNCNRAQLPSKSGIRGAYFMDYANKSKPWQARAVSNGNDVFLGYHETAQAAGDVVEAFLKEVQGEFYSPQPRGEANG